MIVYGCNPNGGATRVSTFGNAKQKVVNKNIKPLTTDSPAHKRIVNPKVKPVIQRKNGVEVLVDSRYYYPQLDVLCKQYGWTPSAVSHLLNSSRDRQKFHYHGHILERVW